MSIITELLSNLFRKPVTTKYPKRRLAPRGLRARLVQEDGKCIGCQLCCKECPAKAITCYPEDKWVKFDLGRCVFCGLCVDICPVKCLHFTNDFELSTENRKDLKDKR